MRSGGAPHWAMESPQRSPDAEPPNRATCLFACCAALNSCNLGFDIGVTSDVGPSLAADASLGLSSAQLAAFFGALNLCAMVGALGSAAVADAIGRRRAFAVAALLFIAGVATLALARGFGTLMLGRALVGVGVGFGQAQDPIYIAEIAPPAHRGRLVTWCEIGTNVGILFGFACGAALISTLPTGLGWRGERLQVAAAQFAA